MVAHTWTIYCLYMNTRFSFLKNAYSTGYIIQDVVKKRTGVNIG